MRAHLAGSSLTEHNTSARQHEEQAVVRAHCSPNSPAWGCCRLFSVLKQAAGRPPSNPDCDSTTPVIKAGGLSLQPVAWMRTAPPPENYGLRTKQSLQWVHRCLCRQLGCISVIWHPQIISPCTLCKYCVEKPLSRRGENPTSGSQEQR